MFLLLLSPDTALLRFHVSTELDLDILAIDIVVIEFYNRAYYYLLLFAFRLQLFPSSPSLTRWVASQSAQGSSQQSLKFSLH